MFSTGVRLPCSSRPSPTADWMFRLPGFSQRRYVVVGKTRRKSHHLEPKGKGGGAPVPDSAAEIFPLRPEHPRKINRVLHRVIGALFDDFLKSIHALWDEGTQSRKSLQRHGNIKGPSCSNTGFKTPKIKKMATSLSRLSTP